MQTAQLDSERQIQARRYAQLRRRLLLVDLALGGIYLLVWLVFGWSSALRDALLQVTTNPWIVVALFALVFGGIYLVINSPLAFYEDYILPHRFGLSHQAFPSWLMDQFKGLLLGGIFGLVVLELVYALLRLQPENWWLWVTGMLLLFDVLLSNLAPILILPLFNRYVPLAEKYGSLAERLMHLSDRAGTHVQGVFTFDMSRRTSAANAALVGLGNSRRIILGDTLLQEFSADEIETVLAHELGHHANHDIPLLITMQSLLTLVGFYLVSIILDWGVRYFNFSGPADIAALPLLGLALGFYGLVTMPLGNAISRWRERKADEFALRITGNGQAFASALTRLANQNLAEVEPAPWEVFLLHSHPPLSRRIQHANQFAQGG
jgi:STE24 endopeptidase